MTTFTRIKIICARVLVSCLNLKLLSRRFIWLPTGRGISKSRFPRCFSAIRVFVAWEIIIHNRRKRLAFVIETRVSISLLIRNCLIIIVNGIVDWQANCWYFSSEFFVGSCVQLVKVHQSFTIEKGENFENNFLSTVSLFISFFLYQKFIFNWTLNIREQSDKSCNREEEIVKIFIFIFDKWNFTLN